MRITNKIKICLVALFIVLCNKCYAMTQKEAGEVIAQFTINFYENYASETVYSVTGWDDYVNGQRAYSYRGQKTSGISTLNSETNPKPTQYTDKYSMDCVGLVSFAIHHSLGIGDNNTFTCFVTPTGPKAGFEKVTDGTRQPGDILVQSNYHVAIYIGNGEVIESAAAGPNRAISRSKTASKYPVTCRITSSKAASIDKASTTVQFKGKGTATYDFSNSGEYGSLNTEIILSGTAPTHMTTNCKEFSGFFNWTNVSYTNSSGDGSDGFTSMPGSTEGSTPMEGTADTVTTKAGTFFKYRQGSGEKWANWLYHDDTMKLGACGPTSIAVILSGLGLIIPGYDGASLNGNSNPKDNVMTPPEVCAYALKVGGDIYGQGMSHSFPNTVMNNFGAEVLVFGPGQANEVLALLNQGYCGIASVNAGYFAVGGHILAVVGANKDDGGKTIGIVDPDSASRDGFYTVDQLNGKAPMPSGGKKGKTNANIKKWWIFKYKKSS